MQESWKKETKLMDWKLSVFYKFTSFSHSHSYRDF